VQGRLTMRDCLVTMAGDSQLSKRDRRRIASAVAGVPPQPELHDLRLAADELAVAVLEVLEAVIAFEDTLD
jgi:hypothetical protein